MGVEGQRDDPRAQRLAAHHETNRRSDRRIGARDVSHRNRRADARAEPAGRDDADRRAARRSDFRPLARRRAAVRPNADALTARPIGQRALNAPGAGESAPNAAALLYRPGESGFDRIDGLVELVPVEAKAGLEPQRIPGAETDWRNIGPGQENTCEAFGLRRCERDLIAVLARVP